MRPNRSHAEWMCQYCRNIRCRCSALMHTRSTFGSSRETGQFFVLQNTQTKNHAVAFPYYLFDPHWDRETAFKGRESIFTCARHPYCRTGGRDQHKGISYRRIPQLWSVCVPLLFSNIAFAEHLLPQGTHWCCRPQPQGAPRTDTNHVRRALAVQTHFNGTKCGTLTTRIAIKKSTILFSWIRPIDTDTTSKCKWEATQQTAHTRK